MWVITCNAFLKLCNFTSLCGVHGPNFCCRINYGVCAGIQGAIICLLAARLCLMPKPLTSSLHHILSNLNKEFSH